MKKILLAMLVCAGMCACSNDDIVSVANNSLDNADAVYMKLNLSMSTVGTRGETTSNEGDTYGKSNNGIEYGQDYENAVSKVLVMLTTGTGIEETLVAAATATTNGGGLTSVGDGTNYVVHLDSDKLSSALGETVNVYVYCNPSSSLSGESFNANASYTLTGATDGTPWATSAIFMSNAVAHTSPIPSDLSAYKTEANPLDLGTVEVERSVARFDYKDGATGGTEYTYALSDDISIELQEVALINMSNSFYYLRRVAATSGSNAGVADYTNTTLLGVETSNNWVIDTDAAAKATATPSSLASNFTYGMESPTSWSWTAFSDMTTADNDDPWNSGTTNYGDYYIWRYATENTIPSIDAQQKGITTGVVFKGQLIEEGAENLLDGENVVYVFGNVLYGSWDKVKAAAEEDETSSLYYAYEEVMDVWTEESSYTERSDEVKAAMADAGFTGYSPDSDNNYYVYYYYWNRHNDNNEEGVMGVMEFGVVRNNVYKLSVTDITGFGHPSPTDPDDPTQPNQDPDPDPDPEDPDDPDESEGVYLRVEVEILPWVVRLNGITF